MIWDNRNFKNFPISIHAPREGSDFKAPELPEKEFISIHAPREGSDLPSRLSMVGSHLFQSTLPVRGATFRTTIKPVPI